LLRRPGRHVCQRPRRLVFCLQIPSELGHSATPIDEGRLTLASSESRNICKNFGTSPRSITAWIGGDLRYDNKNERTQLQARYHTTEVRDPLTSRCSTIFESS
jgi:hypothetical protein